MPNLTDIGSFLREAVMAAVRYNESDLGARIRMRIYRSRCTMDTGVIISNPTRFSAGPRTCLYHGCYILNNRGDFALGADSHLGAYCYVNVALGRVTIGEHVAIGPGTKIFAHSNHYGPGKTVTEEKLTADVAIGNNVFIGANSTILPGAVIRDNVVVGAGAVVKGELKENGVYAGVPARLIRSNSDRSGEVSVAAAASPAGTAACKPGRPA